MISAADFKKQVSKTLAGQLRTLGFKGSGFSYTMESENFIFMIGVQASRWGGQCCAEFGIQPKDIDSFGEHKIDFKKLRYYECEFRIRLGTDQWWQYSEDLRENIQIASQIFSVVVTQVVPIVDLFKSDEFVFDRIEVSDLSNFKCLVEKFNGVSFMTTDIRFTWALTKLYEKRNPERAKQFAKFGLSQLDSTSRFSGKSDFERVIRQNKDA